jgi:two-component system, LuxR family, sensor kinase FixL
MHKPMDLSSVLLIWAPQNRRFVFIAAGYLTLSISVLDWWTESYIALGFLYLFPIILVSGFLSKLHVSICAVVLAVLAEQFSGLPPEAAIPRLLFSWIGLLGAGLFVNELVRNRQLADEHVQVLTNEMALRREAEQETQSVVESSPAAIITVDHEGVILLGNEAAERLFALGDGTVIGSKLQDYVPALLPALKQEWPQSFRTAVQCRGQRKNGEAFLAGVWFSTYRATDGMRLAAIIVDLSDDLRNREDLSLDYLLKNTRILMGAFAHEIRNICGAALMVHKNLARVQALHGNTDFEALGSLIQGLERLSAMELREESVDALEPIDLTSVLDELRVLLESVYHDADIELRWEISPQLPRISGDRYGLLQVFLNLVKNSMRAMRATPEKKLTVRTHVGEGQVRVCLEDTGTGIPDSKNLFRPFQGNAQDCGLGLFVSRAVMRSFGGDLSYEARAVGCAFVLNMQAVPATEESKEA